MKLIKYTIISLIFTLNACCQYVHACWFPTYRPSEYYTFYAYDKNVEENSDNRSANSYAGNISEWIEYTGDKDISSDDVRDVVYEYSPSKLENILRGDTTNNKNTFVKYLIDKKDAEAIKFLILAKTCEVSRAQRSDEWWYPTKAELDFQDMRKIIDEALAYKGEKLKVRYLLQAIRAAFTMQDYDLCMKLWNEQIKDTPRTTIKMMCEDYIGGICYKQGLHEEALEHYANTIDISDSFWWYIGYNSKSDIERIKTLYKYCPSSPKLPKMIQKVCREAEEKANIAIFEGDDPWSKYEELCKCDYSDYGYSRYKKNRERYIELRDFALKVAAEQKSDNPAMWQYTAAFLTLLDGKSILASQYIKRAETLRGTAYIKNNIKVLDIMIDALLGSYDSQFEKKILPKLQWLDNMIVNNVPDDVKKSYVAHGDWGIFYNYSEYYYGDMMRKIALSIMSPRYMQKGDTTKAILLNGMASERMRMVTGYRKAQPDVGQKNYWNSDFYTDVFVVMDTLSVENVIVYIINEKYTGMDLKSIPLRKDFQRT